LHLASKNRNELFLKPELVSSESHLLV